VLSRWEAKKLSALDAGEFLGMSERTFRRYRQRYEEEGAGGLRDRRLGKASLKRVPADRIAWLLELYRTQYRGWNLKHFHEHLVKRFDFRWSYTWTKTQLQASGLVARARHRGAHRRKRPRKPAEGMMLHQDASRFEWLKGEAALDLVVTMDDATSKLYSALVEEEGTVSTFRALLEVFSRFGLPSSLYTDRGSHYFFTPKAGEAVDKNRLTQVGRALKQLGIEHIPAYSPEARGRSERMFATLQDRLPKELALAAIEGIEAANRFLCDVYLPEHNKRFAKPAELTESAFVKLQDKASLAEILCIEEERIVSRDNTVSCPIGRLQLPESRLRPHYVKAKVKLRHYPDGTLAIFHGPRAIARYSSEGELLTAKPERLAA
jgi:transposase